MNENPTLQSPNRVLWMNQQCYGDLDINGGKVLSTGKHAIVTQGYGDTTIDHAEIISQAKDWGAIANTRDDCTGSLTIGSSSLLSNEVEGTRACCIGWRGSGNITISGGTTIKGRYILMDGGTRHRGCFNIRCSNYDFWKNRLLKGRIWKCS